MYTPLELFPLFGLGALIGMILGFVAFINAVTTPVDAFGPWYDNTRTTWLLGLAVSYVLPFGIIITGIHWFKTGRGELNTTGVVGRPFWAGPPKPAPEGQGPA